MANQFEIAGREKKASAIADMMRAEGYGESAAMSLSDGEWLRFAQSAGYKRKTPPSAECRRMVIGMLRGGK